MKIVAVNKGPKILRISTKIVQKVNLLGFITKMSSLVKYPSEAINFNITLSFQSFFEGFPVKELKKKNQCEY